MTTKHPIQPIATDDEGILRFKKNHIVRDLLDFTSNRGFDLNEIARRNYSREDRQQLAQLIGYSLSGYGDLRSYVDDDAYEAAQLMVSGLDAAQDVQYPPCDFCGVIPDHHPWHGSGMFKGVDSPHIHACNGCRHLLPSSTALVEPVGYVNPQLLPLLGSRLEGLMVRKSKTANRTFPLYATAQPTSDVSALVEALEWYSEQVLGCRKVTSEGEQYRTALDSDGGARARAALAAHRNSCPLMLHPAQVALTASKQEGTKMMNDYTLELMTCVITSFDGRSNSVYPILAYKQDRSIVIANMQDLCREVYAEEYAEAEHGGKLNIYAAPFIGVHPTLLEELCSGKSLEESITVLPHSDKLGELATKEKLWEMLTAGDVEQRNFAAPNHNLFVTNSYKLLGSLKDVSDLFHTSEFKKVAVK